MISKSICAGIAAAFLASSPVSAAGFLYECDIVDPERARGWISPKIAIIFPDEKSVQILDAITLSYTKNPVPGTISRNNSKRLIVKWLVTGVKADNGRSFAGIKYRASISKSTGAIEVSMLPKGYDKGVRAEGTCKKRKK